MPFIRSIERPAPRFYRAQLSCGHVRFIEPAGKRFELPKVDQVWPCPYCTPKDESMEPLPLRKED